MEHTQDTQSSGLQSSETSNDEVTPLLISSTQPLREENKCSPQKIRNVITFSALWIAYLLLSAAYSIISPFYPQEAKNYGVSTLTVGLIVGVSPLSTVIFSPIFGYFIPQIGLKFMLVAGAFLVGGSFILLGFVAMMPSSLLFVVFSVLLRITEGIGTASYFTSSFTLATVMYPKSIGMVMGLLEVGSGVGFVLGPPIGGILYSIGGFLLPFVVTGGLILIFIPFFIFLIPSTRGKKQYIPPKTLVKLLMDVPFLLLVLDNIIIIGALGYATPILAPFLEQQFNLSEIGIGLVFLVGPLVYMFTSFVAGRLTDKLGPRYLIVGGFIIVGISYFFIGPAPFIVQKSYLWLTCTAFGFVGFGLAFGIIPIFSDMLQIARRIDKDTSPDVMNGIISGLSSATMSFGEFIGPVIGGGLNQIMIFQMASAVFGELLIAKGLLLLGITLIDRYTSRQSVPARTSSSLNQ